MLLLPGRGAVNRAWCVKIRVWNLGQYKKWTCERACFVFPFYALPKHPVGYNGTTGRDRVRLEWNIARLRSGRFIVQRGTRTMVSSFSQTQKTTFLTHSIWAPFLSVRRLSFSPCYIAQKKSIHGGLPYWCSLSLQKGGECLCNRRVVWVLLFSRSCF